jgi:cytochrome c oxidase accessory protein FixG
MFDRDTLVIAYDPMRGEPRGPRRGIGSVLQRARGLLDASTAYDYVFRASRHPSAAQARLQAGGTVMLGDAGAQALPLPKFAFEELGDCIDCTMCVQVCPVGIDIRNGLQYECIACGACIDACDEVMDKVGYPRGLIRYSTQNAIDGKPGRILRPRIIVYAVLLAALVSAWAWGVLHRSPLIADVLRDRNALYRETASGIENGYTLKLANKTDRAQRYVVAMRGAADLQLRDPGTIEVPAGDVASVPLIVVGASDARGRRRIEFDVRAADGSAGDIVDSSFFGPM